MLYRTTGKYEIWGSLDSATAEGVLVCLDNIVMYTRVCIA